MIQKVYNEIKQNRKISKIKGKIIFSTSDEQKASLFCLSVLYKNTDDSHLKKFLINNNPWLLKYEKMLLGKNVDISSIIINKTFNQESYFSHEIMTLVQGFTLGRIPLTDVSFWSMLVCQKGLSEENTYLLTQAMVNSGNIYNYKKQFPNSFFTRRYPTGGVSEKLALLLPTMLMSISNEYNIKSPFTVARSLGFTGAHGTKCHRFPVSNFQNLVWIVSIHCENVIFP